MVQVLAQVQDSGALDTEKALPFEKSVRTSAFISPV